MSIRIDKAKQQRAFEEHEALFRSLPDAEHFMNESVAARFVGYTPRGLQGMRLRGAGPRYSMIGRRPVYCRRDLLEWLRGSGKSVA
jgi:hypothetical protein